MASEIIYTDGDAYVQLSVTFSTNYDWTSWTYVHIKMYEKRSGTLLQTNGYPSGQGDIDLVVPDTSAGTCYFKVDSTKISGYSGSIEWVLVARETDTDYSDGTYDPVDKKTDLILE